MAGNLFGGAVLRTLLLICFLVVNLAAQEALSLQIVVRDDHRRPIQDLKPEEIQITEDEKPVAVQRFLPASPGEQRLLSIVIDSGSNESLSIARDNLTELLSAAETSIWDTKQGAMLLDFVSDHKVVADALQRIAPEAVPPPGVSDKSKAVLATARRLINDQHAEPWFAVLFALIAEQGKVPGRKEIVFFAPHGEQGAVTEMQIAALGSNALRAGVSVYIVETAGAGAQVEAKAATLLTGHKKKEASSTQNEWRDLAQKTGGFYIAASKDNVRDALRRAAEDFGSYYQASFQSSPQTEDGQFRPVVVKTTRPHAVVQQGAGYFSAPKVSAFNLSDYEIPMLEALHSGADTGSLTFDSQILRFRQRDGQTTVALVVEIPRSALDSVEDETDKLLKVHFSVYAQIRSADGKIINCFTEDVPYEIAIARAGASPKNLFTFQCSFLLPPGEYSAEVAVGDQQASNVAHRIIPFSIAAAGSPVTLGDLVLIRGVEAEASNSDSPLRFGSQSIIPWAGSAVPASESTELPVLLKIYTDPAATTSPDVQLEILRGKEQVANFPLLLSGGKDGEYQALVWLPESSLQRGHYTLIAHAEQAQSVAEERRDFDLVAASNAEASLAAESNDSLAPRQLLSPPPDLIAGTKRPSDSEISVILQAARERALDFKLGLPNFSCLQVTKRFTSKSGVQNWKLNDTITELVRYNAGKEQHEILEINGVTKASERAELKGLITKGEFGAFLDAVYSPDAHAEFTWQGLTLVDGKQAHVFAYRVKRANSIYSLSTVDRRSRLNLAFHGVIHVDVNTLVTRFVSIEAEDVPEQSLYREANVSVDYTYATVSGQKFLLPKTAALTARVGKRLLYKEDMQFRDYHRYGATSSLVSNPPKEKISSPARRSAGSE